MTRDEVLGVIVTQARQVLPELEHHEFRPDDQLAQLGANSVDRAEIVTMTLNALSLRLPLVQTLQARNVGELAELLHARL